MCLSFRLGISQFAVAALVTLGLGCGSRPAATNPAAGGAEAADIAETEDRAPPDISDEECRAFAAKLEKAFSSGDVSAASELLDWNALLGTSLRGLSPPGKPSKAIEAVRASGPTSKSQMLNSIASEVKQGGSYKFIRLRNDSEGKRVLFRLLKADGALNYHEIVLGQSQNKTIGVDMYVYAAGERMSQTLRRLAILSATASDTSLIKRLRGTDSEFSRYSTDCTAMLQAYQGQRYAECMAAYGRLSPNLQKEKAFMLFQIFAAQKISDAKYVAAIDAFRAAHPNDACVDLIAIDSLLVKQENAAALAAIDRLDKSLGGDPYLHVTRATIYVMEGKLEEGEQEATAAIAADATLTDAMWALIRISLERRAFADTVKLLDRIQREHGIEPANVVKEIAFAEFVKSPEYKKWLAGKLSTP